MILPKYGVFKPDPEFVYITNLGYFCFFEVRKKTLELEIRSISVEDSRILKNYYNSASPNKPLYFEKGYTRLGT